MEKKKLILMFCAAGFCETAAWPVNTQELSFGLTSWDCASMLGLDSSRLFLNSFFFF